MFYLLQWCVVDNESGEVRVQEDGDHITQSLEKLMLCSTKLCTPDFIDRNYCFRVWPIRHTHTSITIVRWLT